MRWDQKNWKALIEDWSIVNWLVSVPSPEEQAHSLPLTSQQLAKLEELWKTNPAAKLEDLERPGIDDEPLPVLLRYESPAEYQSIFGPLIRLESEDDRRLKEALVRLLFSLSFAFRSSTIAGCWLLISGTPFASDRRNPAFQ